MAGEIKHELIFYICRMRHSGILIFLLVLTACSLFDRGGNESPEQKKIPVFEEITPGAPIVFTEKEKEINDAFLAFSFDIIRHTAYFPTSYYSPEPGANPVAGECVRVFSPFGIGIGFGLMLNDAVHEDKLRGLLKEISGVREDFSMEEINGYFNKVVGSLNYREDGSAVSFRGGVECEKNQEFDPALAAIYSHCYWTQVSDYGKSDELKAWLYDGVDEECYRGSAKGYLLQAFFFHLSFDGNINCREGGTIEFHTLSEEAERLGLPLNRNRSVLCSKDAFNIGGEGIGYLDNDELTMVEIPCFGGRCVFTVMMPKESLHYHEWLERFTFQKYDELRSHLTKGAVSVLLPHLQAPPYCDNMFSSEDDSYAPPYSYKNYRTMVYEDPNNSSPPVYDTPFAVRWMGTTSYYHNDLMAQGIRHYYGSSYMPKVIFSPDGVTFVQPSMPEEVRLSVGRNAVDGLLPNGEELSFTFDHPFTWFIHDTSAGIVLLAGTTGY